MRFPLAVFAIIALIGIGTLALNFDSEVTGKGIDISKIRPGMIRKVGKATTPSSTPSNTNTICDCPDMYGGNIITAKEQPLLAGMSAYDCKLFKEILQIREKSNMKTSHLNQVKNLCKAYGWW